LIITVTLNPAIDKTVKLSRLKVGELNRVEEVDIIAGGKGINVARIAHQLGEPVIAMGFLGGDTGNQIDRFLEKEGLVRNFTWTESSTRVNMKILERDPERETEINEPGEVSASDLAVLKNSLEVELGKADILVLSGSIPRGIPDDTYNQLLKLACKYRVRTILDTAGDPLKLALKEKPFLIKPNLHETELLLNKEINDISDIYQAVDYFINQGIQIVVISMGKQGAIFADRDNCFRVKTPQVEISHTTVGAGDTMVAALAVELMKDKSLEELARYSTSVATAYVSMGRRERLKSEKIREIMKKIELERIK